MTTPDNKPTSELRQQITCITGECPAGHEGCIYIDYKNYDAFRTPKTDKILALLAAQKQRWEAEARIEELEKIRDKFGVFRDLTLGVPIDTKAVSVKDINRRMDELRLALDGVIGEQ